MNMPDGPPTSNPAGHPKVWEEKQSESTTQKKTTTGYEISVPRPERRDDGR
jgi:hypothetical protein